MAWSISADAFIRDKKHDTSDGNIDGSGCDASELEWAAHVHEH